MNATPRSGKLKLSILMVTYNSAATITACIQSLLPQLAEVKGELIVVDNASVDASPRLLEQFAQSNDRIQVTLNHKNRGFAAGNNQALAVAGGEQILILNPDTVVTPGVLSGLLTALETDQSIGIVAPQLRFPDGRIQKTCRRFPRHLDVVYHVLGLQAGFPGSAHFNGWKMGDFDHQTARQVDQPAGAALMVRGALLRDLEGFDLNFPMFFNDVDLCKRVKMAGFQIWYRPEFVIEHLGGGSVKQVKTRMIISSQVSFFRYFEKHFTRLHQQPMNFLVGVLLYGSLIPRIVIQALLKTRHNIQRETL